MRASVSVVLVAALLLGAPSGTRLHAEGEAPQSVIKISVLVPRTPELALQEKRYNARLAEATSGRVQLRTYYSGSAGDDVTAARKIRSGQIDASPIAAEVVAQFVHQSSILMAPNTFSNYKQVDAVRAELAPVFNKEAWDNGFKVMAWWDLGRIRVFSKKPVRTFDDLRNGRPWLYPESNLLKEFYKMINVTGVPLGLGEVYGGLQTNMIDTVWISPVLGTLLRWTGGTQFVSARPVSVLQGAFLLRKAAWEALSPGDQKALDTVLSEQLAEAQKKNREDDDRTYAKLLTHGTTAFTFADDAVWMDAGFKLRQRMVGRTYSQQLLDQVQAITKRYPGSD